MAIRTFNSVGGFSVGETPTIVLLSNGDITTTNATLSGNLIANVGNIGNNLYVGGNANIVGTLNLGNLYIASTGLVVSNLIPTNNTYNLGNSTNSWQNLWLSGNAQVGEDLTVSGNLTVGGSTTYINVTTLSLQDPLIHLGGSNTGTDINTYDGKDRGLFIHNYKSDNSGPADQFIGWKTANSEFQILEGTSQLSDVVSGNLTNIRGNTFIGNLVGTVNTSNQPNITSLGNLLSLTIGNTASNVYIDTAGNITVGGQANVGTLVASNLAYPNADGTTGQVLTTDGNSNLYFSTIDTHQIRNGTSNVVVDLNGNVTSTVDGNAIFLVYSGGANVNGNLHVTGDFTVGNLSATDINLNEVILGNTTIDSGTFITNSTDPDQTVLSVLIANTIPVRAVEFFVKGEDTVGGNYTVATISAIHNGSNVEYSVYGKISIGNAAGSFAVSLVSGNINLNVTPTSSANTVWTAQYRTI